MSGESVENQFPLSMVKWEGISCGGWVGGGGPGGLAGATRCCAVRQAWLAVAGQAGRAAATQLTAGKAGWAGGGHTSDWPTLLQCCDLARPVVSTSSRSPQSGTESG